MYNKSYRIIVKNQDVRSMRCIVCKVLTLMGELEETGSRVLQHTVSIGAVPLTLHIANKVPADAIEFRVVILHHTWRQHVLGDGPSQRRPILSLPTTKDAEYIFQCNNPTQPTICTNHSSSKCNYTICCTHCMQGLTRVLVLSPA